MKDAKPLPLLGLVLMLLCGCQEVPQEPEQPPKPSFVVELSDVDFLEKTRKGVVLLVAYAVGCGPCHAMEPHLEKVAETLQDKVMVARINGMANREFTGLFRVNAFPMLFVLIDGKTTETALGYRTEEQLLELVEKYVDATEPGPVVPSSQEEQ